MTDNQPQASSNLVAVAALHVFLAQHPELAEPAIQWSLRAEDGITAYMALDAVGIIETADLLAGLLGAKVEGDEYATKHRGHVLPRYINAELNGVPFYFTGRITVGGAA